MPDGGTGTTPRSSLLAARQQRVVRAAKAWRRAYWDWIQDETKYDESGASVRDMKLNGENRALSRLLDALQALDKVNDDRG